MRPPSIVWFERLFLLSLLIASIAMVTSFDTLVAQVEADPALAGLGWGRGAVIAISAISLLLPLVLWYFIARRASAFAKWLLVVWGETPAAIANSVAVNARPSIRDARILARAGTPSKAPMDAKDGVTFILRS